MQSFQQQVDDNRWKQELIVKGGLRNEHVLKQNIPSVLSWLKEIREHDLDMTNQSAQNGAHKKNDTRTRHSLTDDSKFTLGQITGQRSPMDKLNSA